MKTKKYLISKPKIISESLEKNLSTKKIDIIKNGAVIKENFP